MPRLRRRRSRASSWCWRYEIAEATPKIISGRAIAAASSQWSDHSARPYSPAEVGVKTSRRKRFIAPLSPPPDREATVNRQRTQFSYARKFRLVSFGRSGEALGFGKDQSA